MKKIAFTNPLKALSPLDYVIWSVSLIVNIAAFALTKWRDPLTFVSAVIGVTALIFCAKGHVLGQIISVVFAVFYSVVSFFFRYYSELITYAFMTAPIAILSVISWLKNPFGDSGKVKVSSLTKKKVTVMLLLTVAVTVAFYFILRALDTPNLAVSTLSIATSFLACYLVFLRSPWYAVAYSANDIVLIVLWVLATIKDLSYLPMVTCFAMFLINDVYGFICWLKMRADQKKYTDAAARLNVNENSADDIADNGI